MRSSTLTSVAMEGCGNRLAPLMHMSSCGPQYSTRDAIQPSSTFAARKDVHASACNGRPTALKANLPPVVFTYSQALRLGFQDMM